jgi:predicted DNA-binding transcriptional regulator AlpA
MPNWPLRRAETDPVAQVSTDQVPDTFDLVRSFTVAAAIVVLVGMGAVGGWVSSRIEAAAYIGCSVPHYDRLVREPDGPRVFKLGRNVCSRRSWLNDYIDRKSSKVA